MRFYENLRCYGQFEDIKVKKDNIQDEIRRKNEVNAELFNFGI